jgi:hypothetical protein
MKLIATSLLRRKTAELGTADGDLFRPLEDIGDILIISPDYSDGSTLDFLMQDVELAAVPETE